MSRSEIANLVTTFSVGSEVFGIEVYDVQEVTKGLTSVPVPLSPSFVRGLSNLRGQIATGVDLRALFKLDKYDKDEMTVVCKLNGELVSLIVDSIGEVIDVNQKNFEKTPDTVREHIKKYIKGIYKTSEGLLSIVNLEAIASELTPSEQTKE